MLRLGLVRAGVLLRPEFLARHVFLAVDHHVEFGCRDAAAANARMLQIGSDVEPGDGLLEELERNSGIEQRAQKHVAADSGETFEIGNAHGDRSDSSS